MLTIMGVEGPFGYFSVMRVFYTTTQFFPDTRKALSLEEPIAKPLKTCLKDDDNKYFVVIK